MACIQLPALATTATCGGLALTLLQSLCCRATLTDLHISRSSVKGVNDAALRNSSYMQGIYIMHRATQLCIQVQRQDGFHLRKKKQLNRLVWLLINDGTSGTSYARSAKLGFSNGTTTLPHTLPLTILPLLPHLVSQLFLKVMDNKERSRISIARTWHTAHRFCNFHPDYRSRFRHLIADTMPKTGVPSELQVQGRRRKHGCSGITRLYYDVARVVATKSSYNLFKCVGNVLHRALATAETIFEIGKISISSGKF